MSMVNHEGEFGTGIHTQCPDVAMRFLGPNGYQTKDDWKGFPIVSSWVRKFSNVKKSDYFGRIAENKLLKIITNTGIDLSTLYWLQREKRP